MFQNSKNFPTRIPEMKFIKWSGLLLSLMLVSLSSYGQTSGVAKNLPDENGYYPLDLGGQWTFELKERIKLKHRWSLATKPQKSITWIAFT